MKNNNNKKISIKASEAGYRQWKQTATTVFEAKKIMDHDGITAFLMSDGTAIEIYGPHAIYPSYLFEQNQVVISYKVSNLADAINAALTCGFENISGIIEVGDMFIYCYLRSTDNIISGLYQEC